MWAGSGFFAGTAHRACLAVSAEYWPRGGSWGFLSTAACDMLRHPGRTALQLHCAATCEHGTALRTFGAGDMILARLGLVPRSQSLQACGVDSVCMM